MLHRNQGAAFGNKINSANFNFNVASSGNGGSSSGTFDINGNSDRTFSGTSQYSVAQALDDRLILMDHVRTAQDRAFSGWFVEICELSHDENLAQERF